jgi:hypothetical protein
VSGWVEVVAESPVVLRAAVLFRVVVALFRASELLFVAMLLLNSRLLSE